MDSLAHPLGCASSALESTALDHPTSLPENVCLCYTNKEVECKYNAYLPVYQYGMIVPKR